MGKNVYGRSRMEKNEERDSTTRRRPLARRPCCLLSLSSVLLNIATMAFPVYNMKKKKKKRFIFYIDGNFFFFWDIEFVSNWFRFGNIKVIGMKIKSFSS